MSSIKEQVLAQQQGQYSESDDKYLYDSLHFGCFIPFNFGLFIPSISGYSYVFPNPLGSFCRCFSEVLL